MKHTASVLLLCSTLSACSTAQFSRPPANAFEKSLRFTEITENRERVPIEGMPDRAEIDLNSIIDIRIEADKADTSGLAPIRGKEAQLKEALAKLADLVNTRTEAVSAYEATRSVPREQLVASDAMKTFAVATSNFGKAESAFNDLPFWSQFTTEQANEALSDPTFQTLGTLLQARLREVEAAAKVAAEQSRQRARLRLEAFLESPSATPGPIHLEGYDSLEQRAMETRPRDAWTISDSDRERLSQQFQAVSQLAKQAERVRTSEEKLSTALETAGRSTIARFPELQRDLEPLLDRDWKALGEELTRSMADFQVRLSSAAHALPQTEKNAWMARVASLKADALQAVPEQELRIVGKRLQDLPQEWKSVQPDNLITLMAKTKDALQAASRAVQKLNRRNLAALISDLTQLQKDLQERPDALSAETWNSVRNAADESGLMENIRTAKSTVEAARRVAQQAADLLRFAEVNPSRTGLRVPEAFEVPLVEAPGTRIELQRTARLDNDRVYFRATLTSTETVTAEATFVVKQLGWHSVLAPSLILARPWGSAGTGADFKFAPAVAWLQRYYPRRSEPGRLAALARFTQMGGGLHITFLDHDPAKDTEIGLGLAASFWYDRLVAGVGWNLMNNSRAYVYVGSNLLPILQALGFGSSGGAGKKP